MPRSQGLLANTYSRFSGHFSIKLNFDLESDYGSGCMCVVSSNGPPPPHPYSPPLNLTLLISPSLADFMVGAEVEQQAPGVENVLKIQKLGAWGSSVMCQRLSRRLGKWTRVTVEPAAQKTPTGPSLHLSRPHQLSLLLLIFEWGYVKYLAQ